MKSKKITTIFNYVCFPCTAAIIGTLGWSYGEGWTPLIFGLIPLWGLAKTRVEAYLIAFAYYLAASRGILPGACVFFQDGDIGRAMFFWIGAAAVLSLPWLLKINDEDGFMVVFMKISCVTLASVAPPLGIIGWLNPLLVAGVFFPGWGFWGILAIILAWSVCIKVKTLGNSGVIVIVLVLMPRLILGSADPINSVWFDTPKHRDFVGINTSVGQAGSGSALLQNTIFGYEQIIKIFGQLEEKKSKGELEIKNIVLPETIAGFWNGIRQREWENEALKILGRDWLKNGRTMFFGAEIFLKGGRKYDNATISVGASSVHYRQRIPVPFSMFRPWSEEGANAYLFEPEIATLADGTKAGFIICYEQFLTWSWLLMLIGNDWRPPDIVICTANNWWSKNTSLPHIQTRSRKLWSRLFWMPVVNAENS